LLGVSAVSQPVNIVVNVKTPQANSIAFIVFFRKKLPFDDENMINSLTYYYH
jgi:hypothetical protein